jgi:hypothetical protein
VRDRSNLIQPERSIRQEGIVQGLKMQQSEGVDSDAAPSLLDGADRPF